MKNLFRFILLIALYAPITSIYAQEVMDDDFCIILGDSTVYNVLDNDAICGAGGSGGNPCCLVFSQTESSCLRILSNGDLLIFGDAEACCGSHDLTYFIECMPNVIVNVHVEIKCQKPDCSLVDLNENSNSDDPTGQPGSGGCISACEESLSTYYVPHVIGNTYTWTVIGGSYTVVDSGMIEVIWGASGSGNISLTINHNGNTETISICVDILDKPTASFTALLSCVCLNSPISFNNTSIGGNSFFWDFGDGNTYQGYNPPPHTYSTAGTYTVTLVVTEDNYDAQGNPLCCCSDTFAMDIEVDPNPGPNIYWISTLCEGDTSKYWTDAPGCNYAWSVGNGNLISGQGNDTICVTWPSGPSGTITLQVTNCNPNIYCNKPVTVNVPVISSTATISGPTVVCANTSYTYTLPKWMSVNYDWMVMGGQIVSTDTSTNTVVIQWGDGSSSMNMGMINVNYGSKFLNNLPEHEGDECYGTASLKVNIKPKWDLSFIPPIVCVNSTTYLGANSPAPNGYTWQISPGVSPFPVVGVNSTSIMWPAAGTYVLTVFPNAPNPFCNDTLVRVITVVDTPPLDSITGPSEICMGDTAYYQAHTLNSSYANWTVTGGTIIGSANANPVKVLWNGSSPYTVSASQSSLSSPYCTSDTIQFPVQTISLNGPLSIAGGNACINSQSSYTLMPIQDPSASYTWSLSDPTKGSISGQGSPNITIQWNDMTASLTLSCNIIICGINHPVSIPITLSAPSAVAINQTGILCPGMSVSLVQTGLTSGVLWNTGATTNSIPITMAGTYTVSGLSNGCPATASYTVTENNQPVAQISTPDITAICINTPSTVSLYAMTHIDYSYQWYCNGNPVSTAPSIIHTNTNVIDTFYYYCKVTHIPTNCMRNSNTITVIQYLCLPGGPGGGCPAQPYSVDTTYVMPYCNNIEFTPTPNFNVTSWSFGDPLSNSYTGPISNPTHSYTTAGYKIATAFGKVPSTVTPPDSCSVSLNIPVCVPVAADFTSSNVCRNYCFNDFSTVLPGVTITQWSWNFGDGSPVSNVQNPCHTYLSAGNFSVTLEVTTADGCKAIITKNVVSPMLPDSSFTTIPMMVCEGIPTQFVPTNASYMTYSWTFGNGTSNGAVSPFCTYNVAGTYNATLQVTDVYGCINTGTNTIVVKPNPMIGPIQISPSNTICAGDTVTLTADPGFAMYQWSTGQTTQSISVTTSGYYGVTVTDNMGCTAVPDSVQITVLPVTIPTISGPNIICDDNCITLTTPSGLGYMYQWLDNNMDTISGQISNQVTVCSIQIGSVPLYVEVKDGNGCISKSLLFNIDTASSPPLTIVANDTLCAGQPNLLTVSPILPYVKYQWNTGVMATGIIASLAGTYTVIATDTITGCSSSASVIVHQLPDLCYVPAGCYKVCKPDTLCGPDGLTSYQWIKNGLPISGATMQTYVVTMNGTYALQGTNQWGCSHTSDSLLLETMLCCEPGDTEVSAVPLADGDCCWSFSYTNNIDSLFYITLQASGVNFNVNFGSIDPSLQVIGSSASSITIASSTPNSQLNPSTLAGFIDICFEDISVSPFDVVIKWADSLGNILCMDTLALECEPHGGCLYVSNDTIYCEEDLTYYEVTICNPSNATFDVGYLDITSLSPMAGILNPSSIQLGTPLLPGQCTTLVFTFASNTYANQFLCYNIVAHEYNPIEVPSALCCSLDSVQCVWIPGCGPCDSTYIYSVTQVTVDDDSCCFEITLHNYQDDKLYDGVAICVLTEDHTININNNNLGPWNTTLYEPTNVILGYADITSTIPIGYTTLPPICIDEGDQPYTDIVIKWNNVDGTSPCQDSVQLFCSDCGEVQTSVYCNPNGTWTVDMTFTNHTSYNLEDAYISWQNPALSGYNAGVTFGSLSPMATFGPVGLPMGAPGVTGGTYCADVIYHSESGEVCCSFEFCITLPDCDNGHGKDCECDNKFEKEVEKGILCSFNNLTGTFTPKGNLDEECDKVIYQFSTGQTITSFGNTPVQVSFPAPGEYEVCMIVIRMTADGKECKHKIIKIIEVGVNFNNPKIWPNPTTHRAQLVWHIGQSEKVNYEIVNRAGKIVSKESVVLDEEGKIMLDLSHLTQGVYYVKCIKDDEIRFVKFIKL